MGKVTVRWLVPRPRKGGIAWYWVPKKDDQKALDMLPRSLGRDESEAIKKAIALNQEADRRRQNPIEIGTGQGTIAWASTAFQRHDAFRKLKPSTQLFYAGYLKAIGKKFGSWRIEHFNLAALDELYNSIKWEQEKPRMALGYVQTFRRLYGFLHKLDKARWPSNPFLGYEASHDAAPKQIWSKGEIVVFIAKAIELGEEMGAAFAAGLGYYTAQRATDIIALKDSDIVSPLINFESGERVSKYGLRREQGKTGARIIVPILDPGLEALLDRALARRGHLVVDQKGRPFSIQEMQRTVREIREAAQLGSHVVLGTLRHTRLQHAGDEGASNKQLQGLSGHTKATTLDRYVWPSPALSLGAVIRGGNVPQASSGEKK